MEERGYLRRVIATTAYNLKIFCIGKGTIMRFLRRGIFLVLIQMVSLYALELANLSNAIEKAREQSVLTQKILANYAMVGMHNSFQNPEETFAKSIQTFEENMEALDAFATSKKAFINSEKVMESWEPVKKALLAQKSREGALKLLTQMDGLLALTRETTEIYTRQTGSMLGKIIDASADIGIHAQRMSMLYLLKAWGEKEARVDKEMKRSIAQFQKSITLLKDARVNTPEIRKVLKEVERAFMYFTVMDTLDSSAIPTLIYQKSNTILKAANTLAVLYNKTITLN